MEVASFFGISSIFSASNAPRNLTTCFAFSLVIVHPRSERSVIFRLEKTVERGKMAVDHLPSRLNAISIFSSPVSMLFNRCVRMMGVRHTRAGLCVFWSITLIPLSE